MRISLRDVTKRFGRQTVIHPLDLEIESGAFTTLLGPSGCGKTTLLRMIAGLETPDEGEICLDGTCVFSSEKRINLPPEQRGLGFVFQDFALWPHMTVFENVAFGLRAQKRRENLKEKVEHALRAVQMEHLQRRYPHQLSGGQQQRVAFARAIVLEPSCILFDEPLSALDALLREEMRAELKALVERLGATSVFVTHDQAEAMGMSDTIVVLQGGEIQQSGTPEEIYNYPANSFVARFVGRSNWLGESAMFRPEAVRLEPFANARPVKASVLASQFLGDRYELQLTSGRHTWLIPSRTGVAYQKEITVYLDETKIINFQQGAMSEYA